MKRIILFLCFAMSFVMVEARSQKEPGTEPQLRAKTLNRELKTGDPKQMRKERWYEYLLSADSMHLGRRDLYPDGYLTPGSVENIVPMSSVVCVQVKNRRRRIDIIPFKVRSGKFSISNGQAQNWSPFPDAYLDARTLSFPHTRR